MKLEDLRPLIKDSETYVITVSNDLNRDSVIRTITGADLKTSGPGSKNSYWLDPPLEFLMNQEVESISSRVQVTEIDDCFNEDGDRTIARIKARFDSATVIRLSLSVGQLNEIRRRAWAKADAKLVWVSDPRDREVNNNGQAN